MFPPQQARTFEREMGCTEAEWLGWLPGAVGAHPLTIDVGRAVVRIGDGRLTLRWTPLPPRQIALVRLPRMQVRFEFDDVAIDARQRFLRHFDLFMQRGGG